MMRKGLKIFFGFLAFVVLALVLIPILFQDKIIALLKEKINDNVNAKVEFADANLSLLRNFPNASIQLTDILVTNYQPFEGDTLFYGNKVNLKVSLSNVISGNDINIKSFYVNEAKANILVNKNGVTNYDIAKKSSEENKKNTNKKAKNIAINSYEINQSSIVYKDEKGKIFLALNNFNHSGYGDLSEDKTTLKTQTDTDFSFKMDETSYADNIHLDLNAAVDADLKNNRFSFLKNEAHINQLPLIFDGFLQLNDNTKELNINFKTPSSDFKNFLALVPKKYAKNISDVQTTGNFSVVGKVDGIIDDKHIPKIDVNINSNNASFKYPDLPKSVQNIHINTAIKNNTGLVENTLVQINNLSFKIDDNTFRSKAIIKQLTTNPIINASAKGKFDLADINKVYPIESENKLSGLINADLTTQFDAEALKKNIPERIKNNGIISINDFVYSSKDVVNPIAIKNAEVDFKPTKISLTNFDAKTGSTDLKATGTIDNLLGFLLSNKELKGKFAINSNKFRVSDFMEANTNQNPKETEEPTTDNKPTESLKFPAFLNIKARVNAKNVYYDNLHLTNVLGTLILKDEKAILKDVNANMFDGKIALNGAINTQKETPVFDMKMGIKDFNIGTSISSIKMFEKLAPIASVLDGKFSTNIDLMGKLTNDFTPDLQSVKGNAFAQVLTQQLNPKKSKTMSLLSNKLSFIDFKKLNLDNIKAYLDFKDGKVNVKPFKTAYKDIDINIGGSHGFDQSMNYNVTFDVPAKYLGKEIESLLTKLDASNQNIKVPVTANLTGSFESPLIKTDLSTAVTNLTSQLVKQQKEKLVGGLLGKVLGGNTAQKESDSTKTETNDVIKKGVNDILGGLFSKKSVKKDTVK